MLDAGENSTFDEAMRKDPALRKVSLEMDRLAVAIAASAATPIQPAGGLLEEIQHRLKLNPARQRGRWLAISGWAAALLMALFHFAVRSSEADTAAAPPPPLPVDSGEVPATTGSDSSSKAVTDRLTQEIEMLHENLESYQQRDRTLFTTSPGMALPIVMTMTPPGMTAGDFQITTLLGDALRAATTIPEDLPKAAPPDQENPLPPQDPAVLVPAAPVPPSAIPIYDPARDFGTLVISNLPAAAAHEVYNLWVTTRAGGEPIHVGRLPQNTGSGADSFDFSLGSTMVLPTGFMLTRDPANHPTAPSASNIVLQAPSH